MLGNAVYVHSLAEGLFKDLVANIHEWLPHIAGPSMLTLKL